ncbi:hypothetical protein DRQ18_01820 [bacterium]|nr:MAG: hypothetical protein DRQ18_01820 [bacterium]
MVTLLLSVVIIYQGERYEIPEVSGYVNVADLQEVIGFSTRWDREKKFLYIKKNMELKLMPDNTFFEAGKEVYQLSKPMKLIEGKLMLHRETLPELLSLLTGEEFFEKGGTIYAGRNVNVLGVDIEEKKGVTKVKIKIKGNLRFYYEGKDTLWKLTIFDAVPTPGMVLIPKGFVKKVKMEEKENYILFTFVIEDGNKDVDVRKDKDAIIFEVKEREKREIKTIVIDAGHGGKDPGAIGPSGLEEKYGTRDVAKRLAAILKRKGFNIIMTRTDDTFIPLKERTRIADEARADLFISIHCNAVPKRKKKEVKKGVEVYFLSAAKTDWERAVEARENSSIEFEKTNSVPVPELEYILWDLAQNIFLEESSELAIAIQEELCKTTGLYNRGVKQANFYVLRLNYMPAVLVEIGFISNPHEEKLLKSSSFREKIAEGIARGIERFIREYEKKY